MIGARDRGLGERQLQRLLLQFSYSAMELRVGILCRKREPENTNKFYVALTPRHPFEGYIQGQVLRNAAENKLKFLKIYNDVKINFETR